MRENKHTGAVLCEIVRRLAMAHRADIIVIDPALAYLGGDSNSQADVGNFLRTSLQPVLDEIGAAAIIVHHSSKGVQTGTKTSTRSDAYVGTGSAEWANASRAVVSVSPTEIPGVVELIAAKRGGRLKWKTDLQPFGNTFNREMTTRTCLGAKSPKVILMTCNRSVLMTSFSMRLRRLEG